MNTSELEMLSDLYGIESDAIERILNSELSSPEDKLLKLMSIATAYFGTRKRAQSWFVTENIGLGSVTPLSLLMSDAGFASVKNSVNRLNHGMTC
ncbi:MbcA/ParS/Xre antitoxin family protein [Paraglaciecola sp. L1A13]|uniref:MbcA/ParS/Xre antitoxin family protein n=1 Tax=Paraglaciecola sp. L1A13 TaxID=2686359 RepID=UPI00131BDCB3|nr:MbcA/ParS/Xre antitoxin family protein [Paraglaciecola sp. L1A13]